MFRRTFVIISITSFFAFLLCMANVDIRISEDVAREMGETGGFCVGQSLALDAIVKKYPDLSKQAQLVKSKFEAIFGPAIKNIDGKMSEIEPSWDTVKKKMVAQMSSQIKATALSHNESKNFIEKVEDRCNGNIPSPVIETLLMFHPKYQHDPLAEYNAGFKERYLHDHSTKSTGVKFHIDYPQSWSSLKGNHPNVVRKFLSQNGRGLEVIVIIVKAAPFLKDKVPTRKDIKGIANTSEFKKMIPENWELVNIHLSTLETLPCLCAEYKATITELDTVLLMYARSYTVFCNNTMIQIQATVTTSPDHQNELEIKSNKFYPLFKSIVRSLVIYDLWEQE